MIADMTDGQLTLLLTTITGFAIQIVSQILSVRKQRDADRAAHNQRIQDRLDRISEARILMEKQKVEADLIRAKQELTAKSIHQHIQKSAEVTIQNNREIKHLISKNNDLTYESKQVAVSAFNEANNINRKLHDIGLERAHKETAILQHIIDTKDKLEAHKTAIVEVKDRIDRVAPILDEVVPVLPEVVGLVKKIAPVEKDDV